jgi:hypothetical protein
MRVLIILLIVSIVLSIFYFKGSFKRLSDELLQPDQNPELVSYLQGDWALSNDKKSVLRIKRDSLVEFYNDTVRSANSLYYIFNRQASKYFTKDSSFAFSTLGGSDLSTNDFKLREINRSLNDTTLHTLVYVSRSRVDMISHGKTFSFNRVK